MTVSTATTFRRSLRIRQRPSNDVEDGGIANKCHMGSRDLNAAPPRIAAIAPCNDAVAAGIETCDRNSERCGDRLGKLLRTLLTAPEA